MWKEKSMNLRGGNKFDSRYEPGVPHRAHSSWAQLKENKRVSCVIKRENCYSDAKASLAHTERWKAQINICFNHKGASFCAMFAIWKFTEPCRTIHRDRGQRKLKVKSATFCTTPNVRQQGNIVGKQRINKYNTKEVTLYSLVYVGGQCTRKTLQQ